MVTTEVPRGQRRAVWSVSCGATSNTVAAQTLQVFLFRWLCPPDLIPPHPLTPARYGLGWNQKPTAVRLSLSRLNHWLPRAQAHPEVMQGTADLHHYIADALLPEADAIFHNATALHATVDMLDT